MFARKTFDRLRPGVVCPAAVVATALLVAPAGAVTYEIDFGPGAVGSFTAPAVGGPVSNLQGLIAGILFDVRLPGTTTFDYDPAVNDFVYAGAFPSYTNSMAYPICGPGECFLQFYPFPDPVVPSDYLAVDKDFNNIDAGTKYVIVPPAPIPLPPALGLMAAALGGLAMAARRRPQSPGIAA